MKCLSRSVKGRLQTFEGEEKDSEEPRLCCQLQIQERGAGGGAQ